MTSSNVRRITFSIRNVGSGFTGEIAERHITTDCAKGQWRELA